MSEPKTKKTAVSVDAFLEGVGDPQRRADALSLLALMKDITGETPRMWGPTMVGFGDYHYAYESGHEGDTFLTGFAPRKNALVIYFMAGFFEQVAPQLQKLGKCTTSKGCLYIKKLADVDLGVLRQLLEANIQRLSNLNKPKPAAKHVKKKHA